MTLNRKLRMAAPPSASVTMAVITLWPVWFSAGVRVIVRSARLIVPNAILVLLLGTSIVLADEAVTVSALSGPSMSAIINGTGPVVVFTLMITSGMALI